MGLIEDKNLDLKTMYYELWSIKPHIKIQQFKMTFVRSR